MEGTEKVRNEITRRQALKRVGAVGAIAWATPVITSLNQKAFAASPGPGNRAQSVSGANNEIEYNVAASPSTTRYAKFDFGTGGGTMDYRDTDHKFYHVAFSAGFFDGSGAAWACGPITSGNILVGSTLLLKVVDTPKAMSGDVVANCAGLTIDPVTFALINSGDIAVT